MESGYIFTIFHNYFLKIIVSLYYRNRSNHRFKPTTINDRIRTLEMKAQFAAAHLLSALEEERSEQLYVESDVQDQQHNAQIKALHIKYDELHTIHDNMLQQHHVSQSELKALHIKYDELHTIHDGMLQQQHVSQLELKSMQLQIDTVTTQYATLQQQNISTNQQKDVALSELVKMKKMSAIEAIREEARQNTVARKEAQNRRKYDTHTSALKKKIEHHKQQLSNTKESYEKDRQVWKQQKSTRESAVAAERAGHMAKVESERKDTLAKHNAEMKMLSIKAAQDMHALQSDMHELEKQHTTHKRQYDTQASTLTEKIEQLKHQAVQTLEDKIEEIEHAHMLEIETLHEYGLKREERMKQSMKETLSLHTAEIKSLSTKAAHNIHVMKCDMHELEEALQSALTSSDASDSARITQMAEMKDRHAADIESHEQQYSDLEIIMNARSKELSASSVANSLITEKFENAAVIHARVTASKSIELQEMRKSLEWMDCKRHEEKDAMQQKYVKLQNEAISAMKDHHFKCMVAEKIKWDAALVEAKRVHTEAISTLQTKLSAQAKVIICSESKLSNVIGQHTSLLTDVKMDNAARIDAASLKAKSNLKQLHSKELAEVRSKVDKVVRAHALGEKMTQELQNTCEMHQRHMIEIQSRHDTHVNVLNATLQKERKDHREIVRKHASNMSYLTDEWTKKSIQYDREKSSCTLEISRLKEKMENLQYQMKQTQKQKQKQTTPLLQQHFVATLSASSSPLGKKRQALLLQVESELLTTAREELASVKSEMSNQEQELKAEVTRIQKEMVSNQERFQKHVDDLVEDREHAVDRILGMERHEVGRLQSLSDKKVMEVLTLKAKLRTSPVPFEYKISSLRKRVAMWETKYNHLESTCLQLREAFAAASQANGSFQKIQPGQTSSEPVWL